ncbi:MAG TPA: hypothetical protein VFQ53_12600 [Kofleriaceae bacterium]|nr:hypothetical protein [Kofleriaceae bacterium]
MVARILLVISMMLCACGGDDGGGGTKPIDSPQAPTDGQGTVDGATDGSTPPVDGGPAAVGPQCGAIVCTGNDVCCIGSTTTCKAAGMCPSQAFACDGAEDCNGGTCCFGNGGQGGSTCQAGTNCGAIACHEDADCGGGTPKCCPRPFTPDYKVCLAACL